MPIKKLSKTLFKNKKEKYIKNVNNIKTNNNSNQLKQMNKNNINNQNINSGKITQSIVDKSIKKMSIKCMESIDVIDQYTQELLNQKDFELNSLEYEEAIKLDHRLFFQYYISVLKNNHPLIFSFAPFNDYNSKIIKLFLFFFSFSSDLVINALFFNDDTMHKIYQDKGKYDFLYQMPQIIYSSLISRFIDTLIKKLSLSQDNIVDIKQEKEIKNLDNDNLRKIIKSLKSKFIAFFIVAFIILLFFWYYISCFCGIYENTQMHLIKDSVTSLIASFLEPFILYLLPVIFRILSLRREKPNRRFFYKLSGFLENYL